MTFNNAMKSLRRREGGYVNDVLDKGGETFCGISRRFHPDWIGWERLDALKALESPIDRDPQLWSFVDEFYRVNYWNYIRGDDLSRVAAAVAHEVFDSAVNCGIRRASTWLQQALNALNYGGRRYEDIVEDGKIGRKTLAALKGYEVSRKPIVVLVHLLNILQGYHYFSLMKKDPTQERFAFGWLERT